MKTEYECTILDVDINSFVKKIKNLGATFIGEYFQRRYVYDFNPKEEGKWIRLRTNGEKTTLTIKNILYKNDIGGTTELEIIVSDFDQTNNILEELGYIHRNYQENKRIRYILDNVEIDIDTWPLIPTYVEIEGKNKEEVIRTLKKLGYENSEKVTTLDVTSIYNEIYKIDILKIKKLKFN